MLYFVQRVSTSGTVMLAVLSSNSALLLSLGRTFSSTMTKTQVTIRSSPRYLDVRVSCSVGFTTAPYERGN
jgi:hypothetical protein